MGGSSKAGGGAREWSGSFAIILGHGPCDVLEKIENGDTVIWTGPIFRNDAMDGDGKTTLVTTVGTIHFYWGTATQAINPLLAGLQLDTGGGSAITALMPGWRRCIYYVADNINFGSQENPPTLNFTMAKFPNSLTLGVGVSRANVTDKGIGYVAPPTISFVGDGVDAAAYATIKDGMVNKFVITNPGTGYTAPPTVVFTGGLQDETGAVNAVATALQLFGFVIRVTVTNEGTLYAEAPTVVFSGGGGSGAAAVAEMSGGKVVGVRMLDTGFGYSSNPTVSFTGGRARDAAATAYAFHELNGDCILPEAIHTMFTNTLYGGGLAASALHEQDFIDACNVIIAEDIGVSPFEDSTKPLRELVGSWNLYIDGFIYFDRGKIGLHLMRPVDLSGVITLDEDDFTDELQPENQGDRELWSLTNLTFTDKENAWQTDGEPFDNPAAAATIGNVVFKEVNYSHIIRRDVAKKVVKRVGLRAGLPMFFYNGRLLPKHSSLQIGQVVKLNYAKRGLSGIPVRIMERTVGGPGDPDVAIKFMAEMTRSTANDYTIPEDFVTTGAEVDDSGSGDFGFIAASPRLMILPPGIRDNFDDGWLTAVTKTKPADRRGFVWMTHNPASKPYKKRQKTKGFPVQGYVQMWHRIATYGRGTIGKKRFNVRVQLATAIDLRGFNSLIDSGDDLYFCFGRRDVALVGTPSNQHQVEGVWGIVPAGANIDQVGLDSFDVEIKTGMFGWDEWALETIATPATMPTQICYFATIDLFAIYRNNKVQFERDGANGADDDDRRRRVKFTLINKKKQQPLSTAVEVAYDRNDTSMHPDGTYYPDWGGRTKTTYEMFDRLAADYFLSPSAYNFRLVADVDQVLLRAYDGISTTTDSRVFQSVNQVLGARIVTGQERYNDNP